MNLFEHSNADHSKPLADKLRPKNLKDLVGQNQIFDENKTLLERLSSGQLQSLVLWGPPGCGKTSFAHALINEVKAQVYSESAIDLGAKKIRELGEASKNQLLEQQEKTLLFVDEIHRLNRGQQDVLLPFIEKGHFYLIGATTENPSYQLNAALMSRCRLLVFKPLKEEHLIEITQNALKTDNLKTQDLFTDEALTRFIEVAQGDARKLLNTLEEAMSVSQTDSDFKTPFTIEDLNSIFKSSSIRFDKKGDEHYDIISAFIKSIRGSDPDAAVYYLARMLEGGEDPLFISRRLVILASEDIGNADPQALNIAVSGLKAVELVGLPEAEINLAQVVTYLASAPKSNRSYLAIKKAKDEVKKSGPLEVPKHLKSSQTQLMKNIGHGKDYNYPHDHEKGWVDQTYLPDKIKKEKFYEPSNHGFEKRIVEYRKWLKQKN